MNIHVERIRNLRELLNNTADNKERNALRMLIESERSHKQKLFAQDAQDAEHHFILQD